MSDLRSIIREFVILEMGPVANDDGSGMVTFTRPSTDADDIEAEFDKESFEDFVRRNRMASRSKQEDPPPEEQGEEIADRQRRIMGIEVDREDLEKELEYAAQEDEDFEDSTPDEKNRYYADPKWYTKYF